MPNRPACLIVTTAAEEFAEEIARHEASIPVKRCPSAERALSEYADETIVFGNPSMIGEVLQDMPGVDWVQSSWAGVTPLIEHPRRDYVLTGVKGIFGPQMSEYVLGYLLAHQLKIRWRQEQQRAHNWFRDSSGMLEGKCLGIMGTGSIGQHIAHSASNFRLKVTGLSRSGSPAPGFTDVLPAAKLHEFLEQCDYLVSVLPDTASTECLLDATALAKLPANAYFINVGRSNVVDDAALIDALQNGTLAGAALDVFDQEPIPRDSPLWDTPNLSITAHIAAISHPNLIVPIFVDNYRRYANRQPLKHVIDFDAGY